MKTNIRSVVKGDIIKITPRMKIKSSTSGIMTIRKEDLICDMELKVKKINDASIAVEFMGQSHRIIKKLNPSVEVIEKEEKTKE